MLGGFLGAADSMANTGDTLTYSASNLPQEASFNPGGGSGYLFDKVVEWPDGSAEHVQIDDDGFFRLNGIKRKLVGLDIGTIGLSGWFHEPGNLAIIDKELAYLESVGVRLIHVNVYYVGYETELERYSGLLDLLYEHKMLIVPLIIGKWMPNFGDLNEVDFQIGAEDSMGGWATRWATVMAGYSNVVAVFVENELDYRLDGQAYTANAAATYMEFLTGIISANLDAPILTKVMGYFDEGIADDIKEAVLPYADLSSFDTYRDTASEMGSRIDETKTWLGVRGYPITGWWMGEMNAGSGNAPNTAAFSTAFIEAAFDRDVAVVFLWTGNRVTELTAAFFDVMGI